MYIHTCTARALIRVGLVRNGASHRPIPIRVGGGDFMTANISHEMMQQEFFVC